MSRIPQPKRRRAKASSVPKTPGAMTIRMSGKDDAPLTIEQFKDTLYDTARMLLAYNSTHRIKRAALYITTVDMDGGLSSMTFDQDITIRPYECAADTFDRPKR